MSTSILRVPRTAGAPDTHHPLKAHRGPHARPVAGTAGNGCYPGRGNTVTLCQVADRCRVTVTPHTLIKIKSLVIMTCYPTATGGGNTHAGVTDPGGNTTRYTGGHCSGFHATSSGHHFPRKDLAGMTSFAPLYLRTRLRRPPARQRPDYTVASFALVSDTRTTVREGV